MHYCNCNAARALQYERDDRRRTEGRLRAEIASLKLQAAFAKGETFVPAPVASPPVEPKICKSCLNVPIDLGGTCPDCGF